MKSNVIIDKHDASNVISVYNVFFINIFYREEGAINKK